MNKIVTTLLIIVIVAGKSFAQSDVVIIDSTYFDKTEDFISIRKGKLVHFTTDSISLVPTDLLNIYIEIADKIEEHDFNAIARETIEINERKIAESKKLFEALLENCNKETDQTQRLLANSRKSLDEISANLENTQKALQLANESVTASQAIARDQKRASRWEKIMIAIGGMGIGILTGAIIAN